MKKLAASLMAAALIITPLAWTPTAASASEAPLKYDPEDGFHAYIRWAGMAREAAEQRYPSASLVDFRYIGCKAEKPKVIEYVYKLWAKENGREFGIYVTVDAPEGNGKAKIALVEKSDEATIPSYGKWLRYAIRKVEADLPGAEVVDSHPFGCGRKDGDIAEQKFRFLLRQNGQSRSVDVTVGYSIESGEALYVRRERPGSFGMSLAR